MGSADDEGGRGARCTPYAAADGGFTARLADLLAEHDDALLAAFVRDEEAVSYRRLRREPGRADQAGAGASGVLRLGDHRRGRGRADRGHPRPAARGRRRRGRPGVRHRVQGRARPGRREGRLRPDVRRHGAGPGPAAVRAQRRAARSPRSASSTAARPSGGPRSPPGRSASSGDWATSGSATRSARRARRLRAAATSPRRRWRPSSSRAAAPTGARCTPRWRSSPSRTR